MTQLRSIAAPVPSQGSWPAPHSASQPMTRTMHPQPAAGMAVVSGMAPAMVSDPTTTAMATSMATEQMTRPVRIRGGIAEVVPLHRPTDQVRAAVEEPFASVPVDPRAVTRGQHLGAAFLLVVTAAGALFTRVVLLGAGAEVGVAGALLLAALPALVVIGALQLRWRGSSRIPGLVGGALIAASTAALLGVHVAGLPSWIELADLGAVTSGLLLLLIHRAVATAQAPARRARPIEIPGGAQAVFHLEPVAA